jgi:hypothetical protein
MGGFLVFVSKSLGMDGLKVVWTEFEEAGSESE